ncbi:PEP-CTERM sorting domain-containing protein [Massilia sp. HP4]|uniref:PEP-CTERM sorting domain-containing protein n=1 Tax=Massilia sp. HP4 TaxID=2562316 RepID=UPI0010C10C6A|nr:PEP-CTERM sorting domain-containing protein [Massilia sp. HP4]
MKLINLSKLLASMSLLACTSVFAAPIVVDVTGIQSYSELDDPGNTVISLDVGANSMVTSVTFDVNVTAFRPSWQSEIGLVFETSKLTESVTFYPGALVNESGTDNYTGVYDLVAANLDFAVGVDGILRLEFFDFFDDIIGAADGVWNFGTITFNVEPPDVEQPGEVPEPSTILLMGAGLAMLGYAGRRRAACGTAAPNL